MRNLKRAFSLVLALVMVVSMITIAPVAAADETAPATVTSNFTDAAEIKYTEAVAITGGIGLFAGADGKFMPKGTVTRAQMATIIVKMLYGGDANADGFKGNGKFSDTANFEGGWAEGYINWCSTLGIVAGYGDGTFKPGNQVTTAEAATMILNALKIDAGEGTWPNTVMAKAEEEDFFEDLKPMPGTNTALTREELAVIALNGLNWTATDETGWYVVGVNADPKMTFESYKDAQKYADKVGGEVQPLEGRDSLANKVYDLKKSTGFITANQATGEKYTEVTVDFAADPDVTAQFNVVTGADMIGHKVEVWYEEQYKSEREPGKTYAVSEAAEYITLTEKVENTKEYKAAFGTKYDLPDGGVVATSDTGYVTAGQTITGYVANTSAPTGTYVIDNESGKLCGYIAPATYTVAKVSFVDTTADSEQIILSNGETLKNTAEEDEVVEYDGIAKDHYVAYYQVQGVCVLTKLEPVVGTVTKIGENKESKKVITLNNGTQYIQSSATGTIPNTLGVTDLEGFDNYDQTYTFYLDPAGNFVCFEAVEGGSFNLANTFYVLGVMSRDETDSYGKTSTWYFARGVDMAGNEAMVPVGMQKAGGSLIGADELSDFDDEEKGLVAAAYNFASVEDNTDSKETKEYGLKKLIGFPSAYNEDDPTAPYCFEVTSYGATGEDWEEGGKFQYGMANQFNGNGGLEPGVYCSNHKDTKYIVVEGTADQDYPLESAVYTGTATIKFAKNVPFRVLVTRQANGTSSIEAIAFPMPVDQSLNATMVYVDKHHTTPAGTTATGNVYEVHDGITGEAMEITLSSEIDEIPVGFYSVGYDADEEIYKLAVEEVGGKKVPIKVPAAEAEDSGFSFETRNRNDGRYHESVIYDTQITAYNGSSIWYGGTDNKVWSSSCSGVKIVDSRTDEQVAEDGVARITSMDQIWALKNSMPWVAIELDMCHTYSPAKIVTIFVEVYNNKAYGLDNLVYSYGYGVDKVTVVNGEINAMYDVIQLPEGVTAGQPGFYILVTGSNGAVSVVPASLRTTAGVAYGTTGIPAHDAIFNTTDIDALKGLGGFTNYDVVEYQVLELKDKTLLLVMDAGEVDEAELVSVETPVVAAEYDSVVDTTTGNDITLSNIEAKQDDMCLVYSTYDMESGNKLLVVTAVDEGETLRAATDLNAITSADVINKTDADFDTLDELKDLVADGYAFVAKKYMVGTTTKLVVSMCMKANVAGNTLATADFANDNVQLSAATTLSGTIPVPAGKTWTLDLNGKTLSGSVSTYFTVNGTLIVMDSATGGTIRGNNNGTTSMFDVKAGGVLTLQSGTLTDAKANNGGAINVAGTFNMTGGTITGNTAASMGGAIYSTGTVNISGGEISNNTATADEGGAIDNRGTLNITGGTISGNTAANNDGGAIASRGTLTISGGTITGNSAKVGGAIVNRSTLTISGGTISGNTAAAPANGNGIYNRSGTLSISGNAVIDGLQIGNATSATIGSLSKGASVTTGDNTTAGKLTKTDDTVVQDGLAFTASANVLSIKVVPAAGGTVTTSAASAIAGTTITVTATPDKGYELVDIYLDGSPLTGTTFEVSANHTVTAVFAEVVYTVTPGEQTNGTFTVSASTANYGDTITINTDPDGGYQVNAVTYTKAGTTTPVNAEKTAENTYTFTMPDANVTVNVTFGQPMYAITETAATNGSYAISGDTNGEATEGTIITITPTANDGYEVDTVTVTGASGNVTVTDNKFTMPAEAVTVTVTFKVEELNTVTAASFTNGETLTLAKNSTVGNGITLAAGTYTLDLNGYTLKGDKAPYFTVGSGVTLIIKDSGSAGQVKGLASATASMFKVTAGGELTLQSGTLTGNTSTVSGGAINVMAGTFNMTGGTISGNNAGDDGAAIISTGTVKISGDAVISGNTAAGKEGGAIRNSAGGTLEITGGTITGNSANIGGAIVNRSTLIISGGTITGNTATLLGKAIYNRSGTLSISGDAVIDGLQIGNATSANIGGLTSDAASITLSADTNVTITTDSTVKVTGEAGKKNTVYSYNG